MKIESINQESEYPTMPVRTLKQLVKQIEFEEAQKVIEISDSALAFLIRISVKTDLTKINVVNSTEVNELVNLGLAYRVHANDGIYVGINGKAGDFLNQRLHIDHLSDKTQRARKQYLNEARSLGIIDF